MSARRNFLAMTVGAVAARAVLPGVAQSAPAHLDAALIRICAEHTANRDAFNDCGEDSDDTPLWGVYVRTLRAIEASRPTTMAGLQAKARAAMSEATRPDGRVCYEGTPALRWIASIAETLAGNCPA